MPTPPNILPIAETDAELRKVLRRAASDAAAEIRKIAGRTNVGAIVKREQQAVVLRELHELSAELWLRIGHTVSAGRERAAARAIKTLVDYSTILRRAGLSEREVREFARAETMRAQANLDAIVQRVSRGRWPLSRQVYVSRALSSGHVDRVVDSAIARGVSWRDLANDVRDLIRPDVRGGVSYAAERLGRTEVATAYHATSVDYYQRNQFVIGVQWVLSGSHPRPDDCDDIASGGENSDGVYKPTEVPGLPHPQCLCHTRPITQDFASFLSDLSSGMYDDLVV